MIDPNQRKCPFSGSSLLALAGSVLESFLADARVVNGYDVDQQPAPSNTGSDVFICRSHIQNTRAPLSGDHDIKEKRCEITRFPD